MRILCAALVLSSLACADPTPKLKLRDEVCAKNRDCGYGLDCVDGAAMADGGVASGKSCQWHSFGDCEGDGTQPGPDGQPQCLNSYKCRENHCTVQCAGHKDCKEGEICNVGICQKGKNANARCYDNRDCRYPESCYYGQCVTRAVNMRCNTDLDCSAGSRCINNVCQ